MSKSKRKINSPDVLAFRNAQDKMHLPLFVKKHNDEGTEFYYMGDVSPISDKFVQTTMGENVSVVKMKFSMNQPVADEIYDYITDKKDI